MIPMHRSLLLSLITCLGYLIVSPSAHAVNTIDPSLREAFADARLAAKPVEDSPGHWWMQNPSHGLNARVTTDGLCLRVRDRDASVAPRFTRWRTTSMGCGDEMTTVSSGVVRSGPTSSNRIEIVRHGLIEWFVNRPSGLEHGYTVREAPSGRKPGRLLRLEMILDGDLECRITDDGRHVTLHDESGAEVLRYEKLKAWDASGRELSARMTGGKKLLAVEVDDEGAVYPLTIDPTFMQRNYLKASNAETEDEFARSIAIDGDTILIGAPGEDGGATGVNGDESDNSLIDAGAAYVFVRANGGWTKQAYLKASNAGTGDRFGASVSIDGDFAVVGAPEDDGKAGAAHVFQRGGTIWSHRALLKAVNAGANDLFGLAVAVSGDRILVGAVSEDSNAVGINGDGGNNLMSDSGAAYLFAREGILWNHEAYLKASNPGAGDRFGASVAIDGDAALVGAPGESSNATGSNGDESNDLANSAGAVYAFRLDGAAWEQEAYLKASNTHANTHFGCSVALDGDTALIGACYEDGASRGVGGDETDLSLIDAGAAYVFVRDGAGWTQQAYLKASNPGSEEYFGWSVDVSGHYAIVGAQGESSNAVGINGDGGNDLANSSGAAYLFRREGATWFHQDYLKSSNSESLDAFGLAVAIDGTIAAVGAPLEDGASVVIDGDQSDNNAPDAGAAYVFSLASPGKAIAGSFKRFKSTPVGSRSKSQTLVIRNTGELALTGLKFSLGGKAKKDFRIVAPVGSSLEPGASLMIKVTFRPKEAGKRKASLTLASQGDPVIVDLSGKGQ